MAEGFPFDAPTLMFAVSPIPVPTLASPRLKDYDRPRNVFLTLIITPFW